jgi:hypothetical protein
VRRGLGRAREPHLLCGDETQTIRVQVREDGLSIDQIVLSAGTFLTTAPGATKDDPRIVSDSV